jgi:hypothetical protein
MKVWIVANQWEGQRVPLLKPFPSRPAAEKYIQEMWANQCEDCDYNSTTPCPEIVVVDSTLHCHFDSDNWFWIIESEMTPEDA